MSESEEVKGADQRAGGKLSLLSALYVELLGTLVPGLFAVLLGSAILILTFGSIYAIIFESGDEEFGLLKNLNDVLGNLHYEIAVITLVASYVIGSVFFRRDPKKPDATSAVYAWMHSSATERRGLAVQSEKCQWEKPRKPRWWDDIKAFMRPGKYLHKYNLKAEFPYLNFRCYLGARRVSHLTKHIPWCPKVKGTFECRTKMFINMLKVRLQAFAPRLCWDIIRNEAHVRLATSVWYVANWLIFLSVISLGFLLATVVKHHDEEALRTAYPAGVLSFLVFFLCVVMKFHLRKCIHYMRVREVFYVLETAHIAQRLDKRFRIGEVTGKRLTRDCTKCGRIKV